MAVTIKAQRPTMTVNIGGEREVEVPLTFNRAEAVEFGKAEDGTDAMFGFFRKYLGEVLDEIGDDDLNALLKAWTEGRRELGEPSLGEPQASPTQ